MQLKANGVFLVDDFGCQHIPPQKLLNRWIISLEERQNFLRLRTGQRSNAGCHPRDLLEQILDHAHYHWIKPVLNPKILERAVGKYFL